MKKMMAILLAMIMIIATCSVASADNIANPFEFWAQSKSANGGITDNPDGDGVYKSTSCPTRAIFVKHWVYGGSDEYTNYFAGRQVIGSSRYTRGTKWCEVNSNVPIQNSNITPENWYSIAGRGNTNHYEYDGVSRVSLHGYYYVNFDWTVN